jgi:nitrogen fixation/metabolism regulation signal transduction histidine kinase
LRTSLEGRLVLYSIALVTVAVLVTAALVRVLGEPVSATVASLVVVVTAAIWIGRRAVRPVARTLHAVADGVASMRDRDFSVSITRTSDDEIGALVDSYNQLGAVLRDERQSLYQRELLLDTVIQSTPLAMLLTSAAGVVLYSNTAARRLFGDGRKLEGAALATVLEPAPPPLREAIARRADTLFTVDDRDEPEIWHLSCRRFVLNARPHDLYLLKQLTRELARQEVATWKRVIRVIAHELNNSLAPISSLAHSGLVLAERQDPGRLPGILATIEDRARHLHDFIDGYARFAKLPQPRLDVVEWPAFLAGLARSVEFTLRGSPPDRAAHFDPAQIGQVLINLIKNAHEAGSTAANVEVEVASAASGWLVQVDDRGGGMSESVLAQALLPFYSTKSTGTGLGLPLCREIVEAHGGRMSLNNRSGGGLAIAIWLPDGGAEGLAT